MSSARILIIEDDNMLSNQMAELLRGQGFDVNQRHDGQEGLVAALKDSFDLILLDVLLPTINGFSVLNRLRKVQQTPVMMITACGAESERIEGYAQGADDYLPKPFNLTEMLLRINALLRRTRVISHRAWQQSLEAGGLVLQRTEKRATFNGRDIELTPIQFRLLWVLVENRNEVLSKPYLYQAVLERSFSRYDRTLDMHVSRVRKKLEEVGMDAECLLTVHGKGYRFI